MPSKRKGVKKGKQGRRKGPTEVKVRTLGGFADTTDVTLRYVTRLVITSGVVSGYYDFRGGSVFDPDFTGTGAQPADFDNYALAYNHYVVYASSIKVEVNTAGGSTVMPIIAVVPTTSALSGSTENAASNPYSKTSWIKGSSGAHNVLRSSMTTGKILGLPKAQVDADCSAAVTASPALPWYWSISQSSFDGSTSNVSYYEITIDYRVRFYDRVIQDLDLALARRASHRVAFDKQTAAKPKLPGNIQLLHPAPRLAQKAQATELKTTQSEGKLSPEDAFEEWGDVDSEYAVFLEARAASKRAARRIATTDLGLVEQVRAEPALNTSRVTPRDEVKSQLGAGAKTSLKGTA